MLPFPIKIFPVEIFTRPTPGSSILLKYFLCRPKSIFCEIFRYFRSGQADRGCARCLPEDPGPSPPQGDDRKNQGLGLLSLQGQNIPCRYGHWRNSFSFFFMVDIQHSQSTFLTAHLSKGSSGRKKMHTTSDTIFWHSFKCSFTWWDPLCLQC